MKFHGLVDLYRKSHEYRSLTFNSKRTYDLIIDKRLNTLRDTNIEQITRQDLIMLRDLYCSTASVANLMVSVSSILFKFAEDRGYIQTSPAYRIRKFKTQPIPQWPEYAIKFVLENFRSLCVLATMVALYTGQRQCDILKMKWSDYDGENISVRQQKTGKQMVIPCHSSLKAYLDAAKMKAIGKYIIAKQDGGRMTPQLFRSYWYRESKAHDFPYKFHGLRKTAAARLAEAGCTPHEIASITGHSTLFMVQKYSEGARQKVLADKALAKLEAVTT